MEKFFIEIAEALDLDYQNQINGGSYDVTEEISDIIGHYFSDFDKSKFRQIANKSIY